MDSIQLHVLDLFLFFYPKNESVYSWGKYIMLFYKNDASFVQIPRNDFLKLFLFPERG